MVLSIMKYLLEFLEGVRFCNCKSFCSSHERDFKVDIEKNLIDVIINMNLESCI